jgi:hypothetical protein
LRYLIFTQHQRDGKYNYIVFDGELGDVPAISIILLHSGIKYKRGHDQLVPGLET